MRQRHPRHLILSLALLSRLAALLPGCPAGAADPDFTGLSDILRGRRYLMRIDDVAVVFLDDQAGG